MAGRPKKSLAPRPKSSSTPSPNASLWDSILESFEADIQKIQEEAQQKVLDIKVEMQAYRILRDRGVPPSRLGGLAMKARKAQKNAVASNNGAESKGED